MLAEAAAATVEQTAKAPKPAKAAKKPKKKKVPKETDPAPDEVVDQDAIDSKGSGLRFTWKQHPSIRYGNVFRVDFQAKFQEDARHASYVTAPPLDTWEFHRNRLGIQG